MIVAAIDESEHADRVLAESQRLSDAFDEPVSVVHVIDRKEFLERERESTDRSGRPVEMDELREIAADRASSIVEGTDFTAEFETVGLVGSPANAIVRYADDHDASYLVIGTEKRSPTGKALFGSVAQSILLNADRPVVAVRK